MTDIILASSSPARRELLERLGFAFSCVPCPDEEEERAKATLTDLTPHALAEALACHKALAVSALHPNAWVLGADQVCELEGRRLSKRRTREGAAEQLRLMAGKTHALHSAFALVKKGEVRVARTVTARLQMKPLSDDAIYAYVDGDRPYAQAGCYCFEREGAALFSKTQGTIETIMGLPLAELKEEMMKLEISFFK